ncbi:aminoacyl-tRNA hydrolase [Prochlorococcus marinus]|uniref:Peptidyl-tRNA hydrolase n=1 Tax=Prochlorococcus marinus XMU1408 TaxID=2213228 RepID=A0A318REN3_PROMR|nr:aminoacyl-tRNA hydrolase [Prochlorococcus marinus]MBW3041308.1 aminoacyl-tRNA hydrolase [Prochlorococcus marinus str. XMU1408]PYE02483.1 aminoacyl-tRNA hydrolase [Prochlorococcus marinus XMU1408]
MVSDELKLLVGLGNPGDEYMKTRHNVGFMVLEEIARQNNCTFRENKKLYGKTCEIGSGLNKTRLLMPNTYMNESGKSVRSAKDWFNFENDQLLVLVDDMDLPLGKIRVRSQGGSGGHNGLKSIINHLGTTEFKRLKIGIGAPSDIQKERKSKTVSHVLGRFSKEEYEIINFIIKEVMNCIESITQNNWEKITTRLNSYKPENSQL